MELSKSNEVRFHYLDGLRALAILLVCFHHSFGGALLSVFSRNKLDQMTSLITYVPGSGVELFFVLSGVVLLRPYLRKQRKFELKKYYIRRFQRLFPPFLVAWFIAGLVIGLISLFPTWYSQGLLPIFSVRDWIIQLPIINFTDVTYNAAWWSLGIEIIFYLLVPVLIVLIAEDWVKFPQMCGLLIISIFYFVNHFCSLLVGERNITYFLLTRLIGLPLALFTAMLIFHFVERRFARNLTTANSFFPCWKNTY